MKIRQFFKDGEFPGEQVLSGIRLERLAPSRRHHFIPEHLERYQARGLATVTEDEIVLHTVDGDMRFTLDHPPGRYCLHCGAFIDAGDDSLPSGHSDRGKAAREHVAEKHAGKQSPRPSYPAGYKFKHYFGATAADNVPTINPANDEA